MASGGKVIADSRQQAIAEGRRKYFGGPCGRCGCRVRYTTAKSCVNCSQERYALRRDGGGLPSVEREVSAPIEKQRKSEEVAESRSAAIAKGLLLYQGRPCKNGHTTRYASCSSCVACTSVKSAKRWANSPESARLYQREWASKNPEKIAAKATAWRSRNRLKVIVLDQARRARKAGAPGSHTLAEISDLLAAQNNCCAYCGAAGKLTVDHKVPLVRGGSNYADNLQWLCRSCNSSKRDKTHEEFMAWLPGKPAPGVMIYG